MADSSGMIMPSPAQLEGNDNYRETQANNAYYESLLKQIAGYGVDARPSAIMPRLSAGFGGTPGFGSLEALRDSLQRLSNIPMDTSKGGVPDIGGGLLDRSPEQERLFKEKQYQRALPDIQRIMDLFKGPFMSSDWMRPDKFSQIHTGYQTPQFDPLNAGKEAGGKPTNWDKLGNPGGPLMWYEAFMPQNLQHFLQPFTDFGQKANPGTNPWNLWNPTPQPPGIDW